MKAITFEKPGGLDVLQLVDVEQPTPGQVKSSMLATIAACRCAWHPLHDTQYRNG